MLIGYGQPDVTLTVTGTGATLVSDNRLTNSCPQDVTRFSFNTGAQTTATTMGLQMDFAAPQNLRMACMLGLTLPVGLVVKIYGKRAGDSDYTYNLGGNSQSETVRLLPDGSSGIICVFDAVLDPIIGAKWFIVNNVAGATALAAAAVFDVGESRILQGWQAPFGIKREWTPDLDNVPDVPTNVNEQPHPLAHRERATLAVTLGNVDYKTAYGDPSNPTVMDYDLLARRLARRGRETVLALPRWKNADGTLDTWAIHRHAVFGYASKVGRPKQDGGANRFAMDIEFAEYPPN